MTGRGGMGGARPPVIRALPATHPRWRLDKDVVVV